MGLVRQGVADGQRRQNSQERTEPSLAPHPSTPNDFMSNASAAAKLGDPAKKLAKAQFQAWLEKNVKSADATVIKFMLDYFELTWDLLSESIKQGKVPAKGDIIRYFGNKAVALSGFSEDNAVACVSSVVSFGITASNLETAAGGVPGVVLYISLLMLDGLDVGGNCYLAYLDQSNAQKIEQLKVDLEKRRARAFAQARTNMTGTAPQADPLAALLQYEGRQPQQCMSSPAIAVPRLP